MSIKYETINMDKNDGSEATIGCLLVGLLMLFVFAIFSIVLVGDKPNINKPNTIMESNKVIKPDYRLVTDGKLIDTIYIYDFKDN